MGADAVLLIVAALSDDELRRFMAAAATLGSGRARRSARRTPSSRGRSPADARIVGVNQRDLRTFEVDHERALRMAA